MKKILILSGKGGTGKTTVALALIKLSQTKYIADCDVEAPNLHLFYQNQKPSESAPYHALPKAFINEEKCINCGLCYRYCRFQAIDFINNLYLVNQLSCEGCGVCKLVCPTNAIDLRPHIGGEISVWVNNQVFVSAKLKMGTGNSGLLVSKTKEKLAEHYQKKAYSIIDGPPGLGCPVKAAIMGVDFILFVSEPSLSGFSDLKRIIESIENKQIPHAIIINKYNLHEEISREIEDYSQEQKIPLIGKIPFSFDIVKAIDEGINPLDVSFEINLLFSSIWEQIVMMIENKS